MFYKSFNSINDNSAVNQLNFHIKNNSELAYVENKYNVSMYHSVMNISCAVYDHFRSMVEKSYLQITET